MSLTTYRCRNKGVHDMYPGILIPEDVDGESAITKIVTDVAHDGFPLTWYVYLDLTEEEGAWVIECIIRSATQMLSDVVSQRQLDEVVELAASLSEFFPDWYIDEDGYWLFEVSTKVAQADVAEAVTELVEGMTYGAASVVDLVLTALSSSDDASCQAEILSELMRCHREVCEAVWLH